MEREREERFKEKAEIEMRSGHGGRCCVPNGMNLDVETDVVRGIPGK